MRPLLEAIAQKNRRHEGLVQGFHSGSEDNLATTMLKPFFSEEPVPGMVPMTTGTKLRLAVEFNRYDIVSEIVTSGRYTEAERCKAIQIAVT